MAASTEVSERAAFSNLPRLAFGEKVKKKRKIDIFKGLYANVFKKEEEHVLAFHQGAAILSTPKELFHILKLIEFIPGF